MPARTILCAIDFSAPAIAAARTSATLAARSDATLVLAHVHPFVTGFGCYRNAIEVYGSMLKNLADELRETGATVVEELLDGQTDEALLEASRRHRADLIVIASRKRRGITSRLLYGSLAEYLAEHAEAPTLVVRDAACLQDWLGQGKTLHTFTAVDLATASDAPLLWTRDFALLGPTEIAAGYVNWIPKEAARLGLKAPHSYFEETPEVRGVLERDLHQRVARVFGGTRVTTLVEPRWGQANLPLIELARRAAADVIVVGSRQRNGLVRILDESVSRGLLHDAPMNVVIVPLNTAPPVEAPLPV
jgi:nucleotide-binding universal stress UspA family protein